MKPEYYRITVETKVPAGPYTPGEWTIDCLAQNHSAAGRRVLWGMIARYGIEPEEIEILRIERI